MTRPDPAICCRICGQPMTNEHPEEFIRSHRLSRHKKPCPIMGQNRDCPACSGAGLVDNPQVNSLTPVIRCSDCLGTGRRMDPLCPTCKGDGSVLDEEAKGGRSVCSECAGRGRVKGPEPTAPPVAAPKPVVQPDSWGRIPKGKRDHWFVKTNAGPYMSLCGATDPVEHYKPESGTRCKVCEKRLG